MAQIRKIEKSGLLKLLPEEREQLVLWVVVRVLQRPITHYENFKYLKPKGWYGYYQMLSAGYIVSDAPIEYTAQQIYYNHRGTDQATEALACYHQHNRNFYTNISGRVAVPLAYIFQEAGNPPLVRAQIDEIQFKLPDGCVIEVESGGLNFFKCLLEPGGEEKTPPTPPAPPTAPPPPAPPLGSPPTTSPPGGGGTFEISPPYDSSNNDGGRTYVPPKPPFKPPWQGDDGQTVQATYDVTVYRIPFTGSGVQSGSPSSGVYRVIGGPVKGLGTKDPSSPSANYGIMHSTDSLRVLCQNAQVKIAWPPGYQTGYWQMSITNVTRVS